MRVQTPAIEGPRIVLAVAHFQSLNHSLQAAPGLLKNTSSVWPFADRCSHNPPTSNIVSRISKRILLLFSANDLDLAQAPWAFADPRSRRGGACGETGCYLFGVPFWVQASNSSPAWGWCRCSRELGLSEQDPPVLRRLRVQRWDWEEQHLPVISIIVRTLFRTILGLA